MKVFNFEPEEYANNLNQVGYVHIKNGVDKEFLDFARRFTEQSIQNVVETSLENWRFAGKKMQFLFEFHDSVDFDEDVKSVIGRIADIPDGSVTLCERHIKVYDDTAAPNPPAHKDRLASEITVGLPLYVPDDSYLILYPDTNREINPYSSTALYRTSLDDDQLPEVLLKDVVPIKFFVWPRDVLIFRGSSIYHERVNPANTRLLYLKFNSMLLDPIGEDPETVRLSKKSKRKILKIDDETLLASTVVVSPKLDKLSRHNSRLNWQEIYQIYLWDKKEITVGELEFRFIMAIDKTSTVASIFQENEVPANFDSITKIRRLINMGVILLN